LRIERTSAQRKSRTVKLTKKRAPPRLASSPLMAAEMNNACSESSSTRAAPTRR
jgi:hypothetical protein